MNVICTVHKGDAGWTVEAQTRDGDRVVVTCRGTSWDAIKLALWAEPEPA